MKLFPIILCSLIACTDSHHGDDTVATGLGRETKPGDPCDAAQQCAAGQVCDVQVAGTPICLDGAGDGDGDGIPNVQDFCLHQVGGVFDEDHDGIGDQCDRCPISPPPAIPDSDDDAVDSPCDPNPDTSGDAIVYFEGFNVPLSSRWNLNPPYHVADGDMIFTPTDPTLIEERTTGIPHTGDLVVFSEYRIDQVASGAKNIDAAISAIASSLIPYPNGLDLLCGARRSDSQDLLHLRPIPEEQTVATGGSLFEPQTSYRIRARINGGKATCSFDLPEDINSISGTFPRQTAYKVGLFARGATVRFGYLLVVAQGQ